MEEVQSMVARLMGDGTSFQKMLEDARLSTLSVTGIVESAGKRIEAVNQSLNRFARGAFDALAFVGIGASISGAFTSFSENEKTILRLGAAIESSGRDAKAVTKDYQDYAASVADATLMTKGGTLSLLAKIEMMGLEGKAAKEAAKNAISIAAITGGDPLSSARTAVLLAEGDKTRVARQLGIPRSIKDDAQLTVEIAKRLAAGWKFAQAETETASGQLQKLGASLKGVTVDIGGMIATAILPLIRWVREGVEWFKALDPATKGVVTGFIAFGAVIKSWGTIAAVVVPVLGLLTGPLKLVATILTSLSGLWGVAFAGVAIVVGIVVEKAGGLAAAWNYVKVSAVLAWDWTKAKIDQFVKWVTPILQQLKEVAAKVWDATRDKALEVWDWLKEKYTEFISTASDSWEKIEQTVGPYLEKLREVGTTFLSYLLPAVVGFGYGVVLTWNFLTASAKVASEVIVTSWEYVSEGFRRLGLLIRGLASPLIGLAQVGSAAMSPLFESIESVIAIVAALGGALAVAIVGFKVASVSVAILTGLLYALKIPQIVSLILWGAWTAAVLVAKGIVALYNIQLAVWTALTITSTAGTLTQKVATLLLAVAVEALNLAVSFLLVEWLALIGTGVILVAGIAAITAAAVYLGSAVLAAYRSVAALVEVLGSSIAANDFSKVTNIFEDMKGRLGEVIEIGKKDLPAAFDLFVAAAQVTIAEVKAIFPPLWELIKSGADSAMKFMSRVFDREFYRAVENAKFALKEINQMFEEGWFGEEGGKSKVRKEREEFNRQLNAGEIRTPQEEARVADILNNSEVYKRLNEQVLQAKKELDEAFKTGDKEVIDAKFAKQKEAEKAYFAERDRIRTRAPQEDFKEEVNEAKKTFDRATAGGDNEEIRKAKERWESLLKESRAAIKDKEENDWIDSLFPEDSEIAKAQKKAEDLGNGIGEKVGKGFKAGAGKFDAALSGSTEAIQRIQEARDRMADDKFTKAASNVADLASGPRDFRSASDGPLKGEGVATTGPGGRITSKDAPGRSEAVDSYQLNASNQRTQTNALLTQVKGILEQIRDKEQEPVELDVEEVEL